MPKKTKYTTSYVLSPATYAHIDKMTADFNEEFKIHLQPITFANKSTTTSLTRNFNECVVIHTCTADSSDFKDKLFSANPSCQFFPDRKMLSEKSFEKMTAENAAQQEQGPQVSSSF
jgi:hypothetical protein